MNFRIRKLSYLVALLSAISLFTPSSFALAASFVFTNRTEVVRAARTWEDIISSSDGSHLAAIVQDGDIWTSSDGGLTWIDRTAGTSASGLGWQDACTSSDATKLAAIDETNEDIWACVIRTGEQRGKPHNTPPAT